MKLPDETPAEREAADLRERLHERGITLRLAHGRGRWSTSETAGLAVADIRSIKRLDREIKDILTDLVGSAGDECDLSGGAAMEKRGAQWQDLAVGRRVKPLAHRKLGTVVAIVEVDPFKGMTTRVQVQWDRSKRFTEIWPTDYLVIVSEPEDPA